LMNIVKQCIFIRNECVLWVHVFQYWFLFSTAFLSVEGV
jgi:hypothetical protein